MMRVALGQLNMVWEDRDASLAHAEPMIRQAAEQKADVIVFPEMSFTGVSLHTDRVAEPYDTAPTVHKIQQLAVKYGIAIAFGWAAAPEQEGQLAANLFTFIDKEGKRLGEYTKIHPFTYGGEADHYAKGDHLVSIPFQGRKIGLLICYDLRFPELFQAASEQNDILFVIANWPSIRRDHWQTLLRARAMETQSYVVGVNCYGEHDGSYYSGDSMAVDAIGNCLGILSDREGILICDLEDRAWSLRQKFAIREDRREDLYFHLYRQK